ncbi:MAG TPA: 4Fe-4S dicluster domain-containing protein [Tepidisphaeraceae bacterium]|nr:4Fe-4S dicluster domain-containing protein [Tepidisphaeraceae bacterium]
MKLKLPILGGRKRETGAAGDGFFGVVADVIADVPNAFPPRRTPVPQPDDRAVDARQIMGFFTDTTLCIGCKACEVACKQWNQLPSDGLTFTANSYDNTGHLSGSTWRHVTFKEKTAEDGSGMSRWLMMSDVCKHCQSAPCQHACPTGAIIYNQFGDVYVQNDICNGCGYCITACPFGVLGRTDTVAGLKADGHAHKCTLCMDRQVEGLTPACAKSCPTSSIQFGPVEALREKARRRVDELHQRGNDKAYLYGCDSVGDYGPLNSFFLLEDHPNEYNLPENPPQPFEGQKNRYIASLSMGVALAAATALIFGRRGRGR